MLSTRRLTMLAGISLLLLTSGRVLGDPPISGLPEISFAFNNDDIFVVTLEGDPLLQGDILVDALWWNGETGEYVYTPVAFPFTLDAFGEATFTAPLEALSALPDFIVRVRVRIFDATNQPVVSKGWVITKDAAILNGNPVPPPGPYQSPGVVGSLLPISCVYVPKFSIDSGAGPIAVSFSAGPEGALGGN